MINDRQTPKLTRNLEKVTFQFECFYKIFADVVAFEDVENIAAYGNHYETL